MTEPEGRGRHRGTPVPPGRKLPAPWRRRPGLFRARRRLVVFAAACAAAGIAAGGLTVVLHHRTGSDHTSAVQTAPLAHAPGTYLGIFAPPAPESYAGVTAFTTATGISPKLVVYYSGWPETFQARFAATVVRHHAIPLVQIDPTDISLSAIAAGRYDGFLRSYAAAVRAFRSRVIISFGHEMNGSWYSWAHRHASPAAFVAAWRHIVTLFRKRGATNVTWLWTVNVIDKRGGIPSPARWWPGSSYVNWVGIDGYYHRMSWTFAPLFGPTIKAVRKLTLDPVLITETAAPAAAQPAKISNLFAGIRAYGLLGFVWFDVKQKQDWQLNSPAAIAAYQEGARGRRS
jgi:mannan endo-1,4-beta-mannosidase